MMSSDSESENEGTMAWRKLKTHEVFDGKNIFTSFEFNFIRISLRA